MRCSQQIHDDVMLAISVNRQYLTLSSDRNVGQWRTINASICFVISTDFEILGLMQLTES